MSTLRPVEFLGDSLRDLRRFPVSARNRAGYQLELVQRGMEPSDWKSMGTVGRGVREIRVRDSSGAYRVLYVATLKDAVYVLHCFQKKSQKTAQADIEVARQRFKILMWKEES